MISNFLFNMHGDVDGFLINGQHQIKFPPHIFAELLKMVSLDDAVHVRRLKFFSADLLIAASITSANGEMIVAEHPLKK